jgi:NAD(P)-dependent dehydrogenase (short-subunit alcohol dehydrogenase family)
MNLLKDKVAIITGAAKGNGAGIAKGMASQGAAVCLWDIDELVDDTTISILKDGLRAAGFKVDITNYGQVNQAAQSVLDQFGRIDILVNNAGIYPLVSFLDVTDDIRDKCWDINVNGTWNCTKAILPTMIEQKNGRIINVSSVTGPLTSAPGYTPYAMSKGAVSAMTRSLALEAAEYGININAILPGSIDTPGLRAISKQRGKEPNEAMRDAGKSIPLGRIGTSEDISGAVIFLASEHSCYITGTELVVDGGNVIQELKTVR